MGDFSRGGKARGPQAVKAVDHDMASKAVLVPFGILELNRGATAIHQPWLLFGHSKQTADFLVDGLERWWNERKSAQVGVKRLHIELDNGPELSSSRTQFLKRLVEFADRHGLGIELVYLPPYHSKYNPIERVWGVLEKHWNGALLSTVADILHWAGTMTWRQIRPLVRESTTIYRCGVRVAKKPFASITKRLLRSPTLPKWSVKIAPA